MRKFFALMMSLAMVLALAACGGTETPPSTPTDTPADTAPQEPSGDAAFTTVEEGKLHMSTNAAFPPYEMIADDG